MAKQDYRILRDKNGATIITIPLRDEQVEILEEVVNDEIGYSMENYDGNIRRQNQLLRIRRKIRFALSEIEKFKLKEGI